MCHCACIDGDGLNELVIAYSDRVVRAYRWWSAADESKSQTSVTATLVAVDKWLLTGQVRETGFRLAIRHLAMLTYCFPILHFLRLFFGVLTFSLEDRQHICPAKFLLKKKYQKVYFFEQLG